MKTQRNQVTIPKGILRELGKLILTFVRNCKRFLITRSVFKNKKETEQENSCFLILTLLPTHSKQNGLFDPYCLRGMKIRFISPNGIHTCICTQRYTHDGIEAPEISLCKCGKALQWHKNRLQQTVLGLPENHMQKNEVNPLHHTTWKPPQSTSKA